MTATISVVFACLIAAIWLVLPASRPKRPLPPGMHVPVLRLDGDSRPRLGPPSTAKSAEHPWKVYATWSNTVGPLVTLGTSSRPIVVINTTEAVTDLLEKRSHFSCKPRWPMAELLGRQKNVGFQYYGERLKRSRRVLHNALNTTAIGTTWKGLLNSQSVALLQAFLRSPDTFYTDVGGNIEALVVLFTYGKKPDAQYTSMAREVMHQTGIALQPGRWAVNFYPARKSSVVMYVPAWFPGAGFQRWAQDAKAAFYRLTREPFYHVKKELSQGNAPLSFVRNALEESGQTPEEEDIIMSAAGSLFSAGTDTITTAVLTAILLLTRHPEVQARAYEEIKTVVGTDRLPEMHDRASLPYIDCVIQEIHRFNPAIPLVTHANSEEDEYLGYRIPKKTWIMANVWAMLHDANDYHDPEEFNPDRFLPGGTGPARDPRTLIYGFGRRLCPGMHLANAYLFLVVARTIAIFELLPPIEDGITKMPPLDFAVGLLSYVRKSAFVECFRF
ncbi:cytochrome P450 [Dichomitus squalens]|uniref:Cytochrome P450 n=1 Tax=Dichomitus squalens TaxID=114155 RepID=A0A4Q9MNV2_9APHY|nr:cytochrome P450 [Dichomitus squalens]TBU39454.1 cytochrome P450 [Dichomitus squalens]TBU60136.1 cytochrome P450 [Dichomitus squalens]